MYRGKTGQKFVFQMNEAEKEATRQLQNANLTAAMADPADLLIDVYKRQMRCSSLTGNLIFMQTSISSFWAIMFESYICGMHSLA